MCFFCSYEPELFPGLIYRMVKPRIVLLIFVSGKVVLTGKNLVSPHGDDRDTVTGTRGDVMLMRTSSSAPDSLCALV